MTVTFNPIQQVDLTTFNVSWTSSETPPIPFRVYVGGVLVSSWTAPTTVGELTLTVPAGDSPYFEVLDRSCQNPTIAFPGRATLQWGGVTSAASYRIDESISAVWTERATITDNGEGSFNWTSRWLEDVTTHQFRIVPISSAGNEGTPLTVPILMVRHPDPPAVTYTYNGSATPTVTITAA